MSEGIFDSTNFSGVCTKKRPFSKMPRSSHDSYSPLTISSLKPPLPSRLPIILSLVFVLCCTAGFISGVVLKNNANDAEATGDNITITEGEQIISIDQSSGEATITKTSTVNVYDATATYGYILTAKIAENTLPDTPTVAIGSDDAASTLCNLTPSSCTLSTTPTNILNTSTDAATIAGGQTISWTVYITIPAYADVGSYILDIEYDQINNLPPAPTVTSVTPATGWGGDTITITGTNFINVTGITVGDIPCTAITNPDDTTATCTLPTNTAGARAVVVSTESGGSNSDVMVDYVSPIDYMQDFTATDCADLSLGNTIQLKDQRDGTVYRVRKMEDNRCWMIDNLKYAYGTLNLASTNTAAGYYDPTSTAYCTDPSNVLAGSLTKCGYLYNWYAATGGTGTATLASNAVAPGSICPNNQNPENTTSTTNTPWRLPGAGDGAATAANDFAVLNGWMSGSNIPDITNDVTTQVNWIFSGPWSGVLSGYWNFGLVSQGSHGNYWSSTASSSAASARLLSFVTGSVSPGTVDAGKAYGIAIRCVL